ncbi:MAG: hypothetical protein ACI892_001751, partial [Marinobacter maritimus]
PPLINRWRSHGSISRRCRNRWIISAKTKLTGTIKAASGILGYNAGQYAVDALYIWALWWNSLLYVGP